MKIHFFQPAQFNRTVQKTNPFFDPVIDILQQQNIPYRIFIGESEPGANGYGNKCGSSWILTMSEILGFRLIKWFHFSPKYFWRVWGRIVNCFTFGYYHADICITVAGIHLEILQGISPKARLIDLQHGVIFPFHDGYFDSKYRLREQHLNNPQREYWVYGEGFKEFFFYHADNNFLSKKIHIIGEVQNPLICSTDNIKLSQKSCESIVVSLQFKREMPNQALKDSLRRYLELNEKLIHANQITVFLRHHPRYDNCIDLLDLYRDFSFLKPLAFEDLTDISQVFCHITWTSTTVFEYSSVGIPTVFISLDDLYDNEIFSKFFNYPLQGLEISDIINWDSNVLAEKSNLLKKWYRHYYAPFSMEKVLSLIK